MMKKIAVLLTLSLVVTSIAVAGCGRLAPNAGIMPREVPHATGIPFENCNVCHVADQLSVKSILHNDFTNDTCTQIGCHGRSDKPSSNTLIGPDVSHAVLFPFDNCTACHLLSETGTTTPHSAVTIAMCSMCHFYPSQPKPTTPVVPTSDPPGPTDPVTPGPTDGPAGNVLGPPAKPLPKDASHTQAMLAMCFMCHMADYPTAPTWKTWTVEAGSEADHTGRTDGAGCIVAGCHAPSW